MFTKVEITALLKFLLFIAILATVVVLTGCGGSPQITYFKNDKAKIDLSKPMVILSDENKFNIYGTNSTFIDIFTAHLLNKGINLIDRSTLEDLVSKSGFNFNEILSGKQYFKIASNTTVKTIIVVNSTMIGQMVSTATCRVLDAESGNTIMAMSITNPRPYSNIYVLNKSTNTIAEEWANNIIK